MIDTVKVSCEVSQEIKSKIESTGQIKSKYDLSTGEVFYNVVQNKIEGSYSSNINLTFNIVGYDIYKMYIEGSLHKVLKGQNAYSGYDNLLDIVLVFKYLVEHSYCIVLPDVDKFCIERIDVARVFDLESQQNIYDYLYIISFLSYPRRNVMYIEKESVYVPGRTCTLKIYNKLLEFQRHDKAKLNRKNIENINLSDKHNMYFFDIINYENKIKGYLRYELEIHKRMLQKWFKKDEIKINDINYEELEKMWGSEFMKLYSIKKENNISDKVIIKNKLIDNYR